MKAFIKYTLVLMLILLGFAIVGCEDDEDYNHNPASGMGALVVENRTYNDLDVYIDGVFVGRVNDGKDRAKDLAPGTYRVVLEERHGDSNYRDDVDILQGRLTVLDVREGASVDYDVDVWFD